MNLQTVRSQFTMRPQLFAVVISHVFGTIASNTNAQTVEWRKVTDKYIMDDSFIRN